MDSSLESGLLIEYDEEAGSFNLEWDPETHSEWNFLTEMSSEDFCKMLRDYLETLGAPTIKTKIQSWGSSCGTSESVGDSQSEPGNPKED